MLPTGIETSSRALEDPEQLDGIGTWYPWLQRAGMRKTIT